MTKTHILTVFTIVIVALLSVVVWQNWPPLTFHLLFWKVEISKSLAFLIIYLLGIGSGFSFCHLFRHKH